MAKKREFPLGPGFRKVQPKLRMIANGSYEVNAVRADFSSAIRVGTGAELESESPVQCLTECLRGRRKTPTKSKLEKVSDSIEANVFVERVGGHDRSRDAALGRLSSGAAERMAGGGPAREMLTMATVKLSDIKDLAADDAVAAVELGQPLKAPTPVVSSDRVAAPRSARRRFASHGGRNVLIGIIDVQGFDFAHPDFLARGRNGTRFERIWDQGGSARRPPPEYGFGSEIRKEHMDRAIQAAAEIGLAPQLLEPQSQMAESSHGTHVASIAAGNRGICRQAFLAGVLISLPEEDEDRRRSFYDSTRIALAVEYLFDVAEELRREHGLADLPVSINISLGTNGHAHDASSAVSRWIDSALTIPGRSVCSAAGNAGQEGPETEDDVGFIIGRIHTSGRIAARGLQENLEWIVVGNSLEDLSENELEIWYSPADRFAVSVKPPGMDWTEPIAPGQFIENRQLDDGSFLSVYNELYHPANGANYIALYLSPFLSETLITGSTAGVWQVRLYGIEVRDGRYHGWIERDDPRRLGRHGDRELWLFPSFFSQRSNVDDSSVSSLACGQRVVAVANLDEARERINVSSSQGPTRDGRSKPEVAAPGTDIVAAKGFSEDRDPWVAMSGTSMASPFAAGVIGLMLAENPRLTAAQIGGILQRTARPLPGADFTWRNDSGFGVIDPEACLAEARLIHNREDRT